MSRRAGASTLTILGVGVAVALVTVVALAWLPEAQAGGSSCDCEVQRKRLFLDCLHEYNIGSFGGPDTTPETAHATCAQWSRVQAP